MLCLSFLDPMLGQEPEDNQGHMRSAKAFYDQGDLDAADRELDAALHVQKKTPLAHYWKGMIALQRDDLRKAEKAF